MKAEIIAVGTELLMGQIANTNAMFISRQLSSMGISVHYHHVVGDNPDRLKEVFNTAFSRADIIITTGGLGPTMDDLTKETIADELGLEMVLDSDTKENLIKFFASINAEMTDNNLKQAYFPKCSNILLNPNGTAPGCHIKSGDKNIYILPGPPREMQPMFDNYVAPDLIKQTGQVFESKHIKFHSIGESSLESKLMHLVKNQTNPTLATYATKGELLLRVTANSNTSEKAQAILEPVVDEITSILGDKIYSYTNQTISEVAVERLINLGKTITFAESCTGGMLASMIVDVSGASNVLNESFVTYSNNAKINTLGVCADTINTYTVYSIQVAEEMAKGALAKSNSDIAIALTGNAEKTQENDNICYISIYDGQLSKTIEVQGHRDRQYSRRIFCKAALVLLFEYLDSLN